MNTGACAITRAEKIGSKSVLSRIVLTVSKAHRSRVPMQRIADVVANSLIPAWNPSRPVGRCRFVCAEQKSLHLYFALSHADADFGSC